ncbi:methyltransferase domain-containing protein [Clostridium sp.]|uniref:methyltransferase domain-containing protein n=1 Tax=Clostridium sp. TaxID=1506 RepID=UPI00346385D7
MNSEMIDYQEKLKKNIYVLIENNRLEDAKELLNQYENIISDDIEIYSIKGVIAIMEGNEYVAESILKEGLEIQPFNFDILYNLAYLYETNEKYITAYRYYTKALKIIDGEIEESISNKLAELGKIKKVKEYINRKKVLFIAHIFPPVGGSGVQRSLKFVKYLRDFGWEPIVVTVGNTMYPLKDETLVSEIPEEIEVIRIDEGVNIDTAYANKLVQIYSGVVNDNGLMEEYIKELNKSQEHLSGLLLQPDTYILWTTEVLDKIDDKVDFVEIDMVYTTSGPYSDHIIGYYLKQKYNKLWVADFRDEWTNNPMADYDIESIHYKINFALERNLVSYADKILTTTDFATENYIKIFNLNKKKVNTITNGYDEEDFKGLKLNTNKNEKFTIMHNGILYGNRSPISFIMAIKNLIEKKFISPKKIVVYFTYTENDEEYIKYINDINLSENVKFIGYLNHLQSLEKAIQADLLLLIIGKEEKWKSVPSGKIFEYLRLCKPVISMSPENSVAENILEKYNRGRNFEFDDIQEIEGYILEMYRKWEKNDLNEFKITKDIKSYDRITLTNKLINSFDSLLIEKRINKKKIVFFSIKNGDNFLGDIIRKLSNIYEVRKVIVTNLNQIDEGMAWADICWFEWCDQLVVYGSKHKLAHDKKILCRLHRYEIFTDYPKNVDWNNVDKLILVTDHLKKFLVSQIPNIEKLVDIITINNGVDLDKYELVERKTGFNIAYVGYIHQRKNPVLLLQIINKLVQKDKRYKLYIAGQFQDKLIELYWNYQIQQMELQNNVIFEGWQDNISKWLENKNYILSSSIHESFGYGIAEAMSRGIKPIIHNFVFAKEIWDEKYLFNTVDEAVKMITNKTYNSKEYREFINKNYSLDKQITSIRTTLNKIDSINGYMWMNEINRLNLDSIINEVHKFSSYTIDDIDKYNFYEAKIYMGKREVINENVEVIEFIISNKENRKLIITGGVYDRINNKIIFPQFVMNSKNCNLIEKFAMKLRSDNYNFGSSNLMGYIYDKDRIEDVDENAIIYNWERGIPATHFMPIMGYRNIIIRYNIASRYISRDDEVLEAACGYGYGAAYLANKCLNVQALDLAEDNINFAKECYSNSNISWNNGNVLKLPYKDKSFNIYTSFETLEHLELDDVESYFREAKRVLKDNGRMIISTPNKTNRQNINNPYHIKEYTVQELNDILKKYFKEIVYYSISSDGILDYGISNMAINIIAICSDYKIEDK